MSLNAKGDKSEPPVEVRLKDLEAKLRKTRGKNRKRAFAALIELDEQRALEVVEALAEAAAGKVRAELGALLVSTGNARLIERAVNGRWGDVPVAAIAPARVLLPFVARFSTGLGRMKPADVERRARALGLVPLDPAVAFAPGSEGARTLVTIVDDERFSREFRDAAARSLAIVEPFAVWARREELPLDLALAAGLRARMALPTADEVARFCALVSAMSAADRRGCLSLASLPQSALRLETTLMVPLLALVLDDESAPLAEREHAASALAGSFSAEGDAALLARPPLHWGATIAACERLDVTEARDVLASHFRESAEARAAFAHSALATYAAFLDDEVAMLNVDPRAASLCLMRSSDPRARAELLSALEAADLEDARLMLQPAAHGQLRTVDASLTLGHVLGMLRAPLPSSHFAARSRVAHVALVIEMLERVREKRGVVKDEVDATLAALRARRS